MSANKRPTSYVTNHPIAIIVTWAGAPLTLEDHRRTLLEPSGLAPAHADLLHALGESVVVYHLLGRGDRSWSRRDALLERIRRLAPIHSPASVLRTVLTETDRESLQTLVSGLGERVRAALHDATLARPAIDGNRSVSTAAAQPFSDAAATHADAIAAAQPGANATAADADATAIAAAAAAAAAAASAQRLSELFELRHCIEHPFVRDAVDYEAAAVISERLAALHALLRSLAPRDEGGEGESEVEGEGEGDGRAAMDVGMEDSGACSGRHGGSADGAVAMDLVDRAVDGAVRMLMDPVVSDGVSSAAALRATADGSPASLMSHSLEAAQREVTDLCRLLAAISHVSEARALLQPLLVDCAEQIEGARQAAAAARGCRDVEVWLREVLREVGDNSAREVLAVRAAGVDLWQRIHDEEVSRTVTEVTAVVTAGVTDGVTSQNMENGANQHQRRRGWPSSLWEATRRQQAEVREAAYRAEAAREAWRHHCASADARLASQDGAALATGAATFWHKVGGSEAAIRTEAAPIDWARKGLVDADADVMGAVLRTTLVPHATAVFLSGNPQMGDTGAGALADALGLGALRSLERLYLDHTGLGDDALVALSGAMAQGALTLLSFLDITRNRIGDSGLTAFGRAAAAGAMTRMRTLYAYNNCFGDGGVSALAEVLGSGGDGGLARLEKLWLHQNRIGDVGVSALIRALERGALPALTSLQLDGNPAGERLRSAAMVTLEDQIRGGGGGGGGGPTFSASISVGAAKNDDFWRVVDYINRMHAQLSEGGLVAVAVSHPEAVVDTSGGVAWRMREGTLMVAAGSTASQTPPAELVQRLANALRLGELSTEAGLAGVLRQLDEVAR